MANKISNDEKCNTIYLANLKKGVYNNCIIIEMQMTTHNKLIERFLYYWAKIYSSNLQIGDKYENLRKTISIITV